MQKRSAIFLDRDGTLIEDVPYLTDPARVRLFPGAAEALRQARAAGWACVVVSNQSAIGRGLLAEEQLQEIHATLVRKLAEEDAALDGIYFCPHAPVSSDKTLIEHPDRKPGPGMLERAARELGLDLERSWIIGDQLSDMLAGRNAGCRGGILVRTGQDVGGLESEWPVVEDVLVAVGRILSSVISHQ
jgi:D-glycero-D-manno-heptose 1,7-bisphosphate phosphatase